VRQAVHPCVRVFRRRASFSGRGLQPRVLHTQPSLSLMSTGRSPWPILVAGFGRASGAAYPTTSFSAAVVPPISSVSQFLLILHSLSPRLTSSPAPPPSLHHWRSVMAGDPRLPVGSPVHAKAKFVVSAFTCALLLGSQADEAMTGGVVTAVSRTKFDGRMSTSITARYECLGSTVVKTLGIHSVRAGPAPTLTPPPPPPPPPPPHPPPPPPALLNQLPPLFRTFPINRRPIAPLGHNRRRSMPQGACRSRLHQKPRLTRAPPR